MSFGMSLSLMRRWIYARPEALMTGEICVIHHEIRASLEAEYPETDARESYSLPISSMEEGEKLMNRLGLKRKQSENLNIWL